MYTVKRTGYGIKMVLKGTTDVEELELWLAETKRAIDASPDNFGVLIDMRHFSLLTLEKQEFLKKAQIYAQQNGLGRSATIVDSTLTKLQQKQVAQETEAHKTKRFFDAAHEPDWERKALNWLTTGAV
jgi:hypothetical protein